MQQFAVTLPLAIAGFMAAVVLSTVAHELGHFMMARLLHIPVRRITVGFGPVCWRRPLGENGEFVLRAFPTSLAVGIPGRREQDGTLRRPIRQDILVAAAGPLVSLLLALALWGAAHTALSPAWLRFWLAAAALLSGYLGFANLMPVPGLDGGHLLILGVARLGWQLSPEREMQAHQVGANVVTIACLLGLLIAVVIRYT